MHTQRSSTTATSLDVAALAGVSQPTVSRALRGDPRVTPATRARVHQAAAQLKYVPSQRGRALSTRRTGRIGVVVADLANPFYLQLLDLLQAELAAQSLQMVVFTDEDRELEPGQLLDGSIDGAVLTTTLLDSPLSDALVAHELPIVLLNRHNDSSTADVCTADNQGGAAMVADELVALGHTRIGAIFGPPDTSTGRDRRLGFTNGLAAHGLELDPVCVREGAFSFAAGHKSLKMLMGEISPPTAIFCANDVIALGAMNAAHGLDVAIPEDVTLIGFDDMAMAGWELFSLTTVAQNMDQLAAHAVERLMRRITSPEGPASRIKVRTEMVRRGTHGPPGIK
jgi:LacI family transcriptional regulator